jgi:hypothetical protein
VYEPAPLGCREVYLSAQLDVIHTMTSHSHVYTGVILLRTLADGPVATMNGPPDPLPLPLCPSCKQRARGERRR